MLDIVTWFLIFVTIGTNGQDFSALLDVNSLNQLPLDSLLKLKKNLENFNENANQENKSINREDLSVEDMPQPLALHYLVNTEGVYSQFDYDDDKKDYNKKDVTSIFQLSVTTLAFLAFGGYLLYLVVMAIKAKKYNYPYDPNTTQIMSALINAQLNKRRKRKKKPIRVHGNIGSFGYKQAMVGTSRTARSLHDLDISTENVYYTLLNICEGYSKFLANHTSIDS